MIKHWPGALWALLAGMAIALPPAGAKPSLPPPPDLLANLPPRNDPHAAHFAQGATRLEMPYKVIAGYRSLRLDLYLPRTRVASRPLPVVVWLHGGAFELGDPRTEFAWHDWPGELAQLAARGFAVAAVNYRFSAEAKFPAQTDDIRAALSFLAEHKARWGLDPMHTMVWGSSAGGHLALLVGLQADPAKDPYRIRGIADWFGPADLTAGFMTSGDTPVTRLLGCSGATCTPERLRAASPLSYVSAHAPPTLILHGTDDSLVPIAQSEALLQRFQTVGASARMERIEGVEHAFGGASPQQLRHIIATTSGFFAAHARD